MNKKKILVTGDVCIDWNIATNRSSDRHNLWKSKGEWASSEPEGGAAFLLGKIIKETCDGVADTFCRKFNQIEENNYFQSDEIDHLYTIWREYDIDKSNAGADGKKSWRIQQYLGHKPRRSSRPFGRDLEGLKQDLDGNNIDLLIIDDKRFGFRGAEQDNEEKIDEKLYWPDFSRLKPEIIILRMARDLCKGELWNKLISEYSDRLITVFTATDLRHAEVRVSSELSWEQTISDVMNALTSKELKSTRECKYILVSFDAAGVLIWQPKNSKWTIVYLPNSMEGKTQPFGEGRINGYTYCLISALAYFIINNEAYFDDKLMDTIKKSAKIGILAMKELYMKGLSVIQEGSVKFPVKELADSIIKAEGNSSFVTSVELTGINENSSQDWRILDRYPEDLDNLKEIFINGMQSLIDVPIYKCGKLTVVDRKEIEGLNSIRNAILEYHKKTISERKSSQPLSLAVFGPPGSGKSFAVKQIAESLELQINPKILEVNLSQFSEPKEIIGVFHQIRDAVLNGNLPFVFWDEFDSKFQGNALGWLKYFLAPMQDGTFQDGQITHPIGSCIFVFAGGTNRTFDEFNGQYSDNKTKLSDHSKKRDFISRLKGHLTINGINKNDGGNSCKIRRAILFREFLHIKVKNIWDQYGKPNIQDGVFNAFMEIDEYKHGVRSMEAIILMSRLSGEMKFTASALPSSSQLDIHVDGKKFLDLAYGRQNAEE
jgi:hypothetical protein